MLHRIFKTEFQISHLYDPGTSHAEKYEHNLESENKKKKKSRLLGINLVNCKYECVRKAALAVGLREVGETEDWTVFWTDFSVSMERIMDMRRYQRINHFPGMNEICRKDLLARNLNRMRRLFPKEYNVFPKTWCLPTDYIEFQGYSRMWRNKTFICKPDSGCQGKGIYMTRQPQGISPDEHIICQAYISKPFIIDEYKFDLRLYVLLTSCDPLRIFLYKEGLVRFATSKYESPQNNNIDDMCMHLTNYAINKHSENFDHDVQKGSKRKLSWLRSWLGQHSYDVQSVWSDIEDVIIKTVIVAAPVLRQNYRTAFPSHVGPSSCFELLGFDILLDCKLKPWLLEVNHSPSFNTDTALDIEVKEALLKDTLTLLNLGACDRRRIVEEERRMVQERLLQKRPISSQRELLLSNQASWLAEAEWHEERHSGGFRRIYPSSNDHKYSRFFHQSASYCQETVTSRAREEFSRRMVQMQQDKNMAALGRPPGKRCSRSEGRGHQGESLGEQSRKSNTDFRGQEKPALRQPSVLGHCHWAFTGRAKQSGSSSCTVWDSYETRVILEEEELARRRSLAQRDTLIRKVGVVDIVQNLLRPRTHHCIRAKKVHKPASQEPSLELREPNFFNPILLDSSPCNTVSRRCSRIYDSALRPLLYDATQSLPMTRRGPQVNLPQLCQQPTPRAAKGPRPPQLSVSVVKLALSEKQHHKQPTLPLISSHPAGRLTSHEDFRRRHPTEPHHSLSFTSIDEAFFLAHMEATDSKPKC